jgi:hypothetical protein
VRVRGNDYKGMHGAALWAALAEPANSLAER